MSGHTPGPWVTWQEEDASWPPEERASVIYKGNIELGQESGFRIATVWRTPREDAEGNAWLISAAPELLQSLETIISGLRQGWWGEGSGELEEGELQQAEAAIAKAYGKQLIQRSQQEREWLARSAADPLYGQTEYKGAKVNNAGGPNGEAYR